MVVVRTQNTLSRAASGSGSFGIGARGSGTKVKFLNLAARGSDSRGSGGRVSGTKAKFSKSRRAC